MFHETTATRKIIALDKKIRAVCGGTSASKTISILLYLIARAQTDKEPTLTSVVSESLPHLKRGALRDFKNIMKTHGYWKEDAWRATDYVYEFETGSTIEFFGVDSPDKLRGGRRDRLFINEANNVSIDAFDQLEVRTKEFAFLDWNPSHEFWFYTEVQPNRQDVQFITLTYKDNEALSQEIINAIEARKDNKSWWRVYGLGLLGEIETRIYSRWNIIDDVPEDARLEVRGLDFGYSNDPSALVDVYKYNEGYILDQQLYRKGMSNKQIADIILNLHLPHTTVVADSAEPKSIDELSSYGVTAIPALKGPGSVTQGIQLIQSRPISVTKRSVDLLKEYRNYLWLEDKDGKILNKPTPGADHQMDAIRYAVQFLNPTDGETEDDLAIY